MDQQPTAAATPTYVVKANNRALVKVLKDIQLRLTRSEHHIKVVNKAIEEGSVLNGLRRDIRPQVPDQPIDFILKWEQAHLDFGRKLQQLLKEYWAEKITSYENDKVDTIARIARVNELPDTPEIDHITQELQNLATKEIERLENPKPRRENQWNTGRRRRTPQTKRRRDESVASTTERNGGN